MTASGFPTLAGVLIPSVRGGSQFSIVGKRNLVRVSNRAEGPDKMMNLASRPVKRAAGCFAVQPTCAYNDVVAQEDTPKVAAPASSLRLLRLTRGSLA